MPTFMVQASYTSKPVIGKLVSPDQGFDAMLLAQGAEEIDSALAIPSSARGRAA